MNEQLKLPLETEQSPTVGEPTLTAKLKHTLDQLEKFRVDIEAALSYAEFSHSFDDIVRMVLTETVHFYPLENSFIIMEYHKYPNWTAYHGFLAGGHWEEIMAFQPEMLQIAKALGCKYLSISGRHGWTKVMKEYGWKHQYSVVYKEVEDEWR